MLPILVPILQTLAANGLGILAGAIQVKGKEVIEAKLGVKIPERPEDITGDKLVELKAAEMKHEEFLVSMSVRSEELNLEAERSAAVEVSERWRADMSSDSWLSKNIRPLCLVSLLGMLFLVLIGDSLGLKFQPKVLELLELALQIVLTAYFIGRSIEKGIAVVQEHRTKRSHVS